MPWGRWEKEVEKGKNAIREAEVVYDLAIEEPEYGMTPSFGYYHHAEKKVYLNPFLTDSGIHETRHGINHAGIEHVVERNIDEITTYYDEELADLLIQPLCSSFSWGPREIYDRLTGSNRLREQYDESILNTDDPEEIATSIYEINKHTNIIQQEYFAENTTLVHRTTPAVVSIMGANASANSWDTVANAAQAGADVSSQSPEALAALSVFGALAAGMSYAYGNMVYRGCKAEPLTDENIGDYDDPRDRQLLMLYNSEVAETHDKFLNVMDDYGIE